MCADSSNHLHGIGPTEGRCGSSYIPRNKIHKKVEVWGSGAGWYSIFTSTQYVGADCRSHTFIPVVHIYIYIYIHEQLFAVLVLASPNCRGIWPIQKAKETCLRKKVIVEIILTPAITIFIIIRHISLQVTAHFPETRRRPRSPTGSACTWRVGLQGSGDFFKQCQEQFGRESIGEAKTSRQGEFRTRSRLIFWSWTCQWRLPRH